MSCYVDQPIFPFGRMMMCHLWADSLDELLAMVDLIGVDRKWIQGHPDLSFGKHRNASWIHFDIAKGKRALAIQAGALETDRYGASYFDAQQRGRSKMVADIEAIRAKAGKPVDGIIRPTEDTSGRAA
ncbi:hypothetical protein ABID82_002435 [Methylobacterium sp. PvP062]|uniref:DUF4031 domain-containing protein n=1 Tax=Methylobacterium radiotolerans TaxID=31998 RepID=A0ABV2NNF8_9HYPH|nr:MULTISPECIES: DUF4031 domain-containing protein [unclassified Methylobacterium]MBP2495234.1 hypothetical protein [Methylobacterium sp. PvP105]MBP2504895.1 hypothetical protein [Methylobacterium sp. PvP109]MCX7335901.1 DUF4031 domain-containing protein [Hyphomicrobiales bacterium]